ncbi:MAG: hypothetical protein QM627_04230 [Luteolibacter sp.]
MSITQVLEEMPTFSVAERQMLLRHVLELDDSGLSVEDEKIVEQRLRDHRENPASAVSLEEMKTALRSRFAR